MRNLKRALSLALAAVMVLGLMVVGASAAGYDSFTDKDEIVHKEAVSMITELGVLAGLPDGSFGATQNIDRASFARLVCVVLNGGQEPVLGNLTTTFTDTQGNWAEKYIAFCVDRGIIAGRGNNTFGPSDNVTGSEAAKMLLVALGYNTAYEGIGGSTWEITTNSLANMAGLYKGLETINPSQPLTRDNAAQMIYNVLNAETVTYSFTYNANGTTTAVQNKTGKTMLEDKFNAIKVEGVVVANEYATLDSTAAKGSSLDAGKTRIDVTNYGTNDDQHVFNDGTYAVSTGANELGKSVVLYVKNDSNNTSKATVLGNVIVSDDNVVVTNASADSLKTIADDNKLNIVSGTMMATNYGGLTKVTNADAKGTKGVEKVLIDNNDDGNVDYILVNTYTFGKVTAYSTKDDGSITVTLDSTNTAKADDKADVVGFEDVALNDYVLAAWIGGKLHVEKAESFTGTLKGYKADSTLTVDDTKYDISLVPGYAKDDISSAKDYASDNYLDTEATFYLDKNGYIVAAGDVVENAYNFAYVIEAVASTNNLDADRVKVMLPDGTKATYNVSDKGLDVKTSAGSDATKEILKGYAYPYTMTADNEIKLTAPKTAKQGTGTDATFTKGKTTVTCTGLGQTYYATANTLFFYDNGKGDVSVYTGYQNAPTIGSGVKATVVTNNSNKVAAVIFSGATVVANDVANHVYVYKKGTTYNDYTEYEVVLNGASETTTIKVDNADVSNITLGTVYLYTVDKNNVYSLDTVASTNLKQPNKAADYVSKTTIVINTNEEYKITDKTVVIDNTDSTPSITSNTTPNDTDILTNVLVNGDGEVLMLVIKNTKDTTPTPGTSGIKVDLSDSTNVQVTYENVSKPGTDAVISAVQAAIEAQGYTVSKIENTQNNEYAFTATKGLLTKTFTVKDATAPTEVVTVTVNGSSKTVAKTAQVKDLGLTDGKHVKITNGDVVTYTTAAPNADTTTVVAGASYEDGYYKISKTITVTDTSVSTELNGVTLAAALDQDVYVKATNNETITVKFTVGGSGTVQTSNIKAQLTGDNSASVAGTKYANAADEILAVDNDQDTKVNDATFTVTGMTDDVTLTLTLSK